MSQNDGGKRAGTAFGILGLLVVLALKFKVGIFAFFKALTFIKFGWLLSSFSTMFLSIGLYAMLWGWPYAFAIVLLLLIHEMGHYIWMKALGLNPNAPIFVPGLGAYVAMKNMPDDEAQHAWVAIAGPLVGGLGCAALYWTGIHTDNHWLMGAGSTGFMLNLFQLIPAKPFDGGFIVSAISRWLMIPGTVLLLTLTFMIHSPLLLIISVISVFVLIGQFRNREPRSNQPSQHIGGSSGSISVRDLERVMRSHHASMPDSPPYQQPNPTSNPQPANPLTSPTTPQHPHPDEDSSQAAREAAKTTSIPLPPRTEMKPATPVQKVLIGIAYISLAGMLAYLYWLSHSEVVSLMPPKHRDQLTVKHEKAAPKEDQTDGAAHRQQSSADAPEENQESEPELFDAVNNPTGK